MSVSTATTNAPSRARDLGIPLKGVTGTWNAITDVEGVLVGHTTLIEGEGILKIGQGPVRTGVTVVLPRGRSYDPVFAGVHVLNGNGEMTGTIWIEESGFLESPIGLTNTHSVGTVRDSLIAWQHERSLYDPIVPGVYWSLAVAAETWDGWLNDINGQHVRREHVYAALDSAASGAVAEGGVGSGTGMVCHGFKGGIGTSSRVVENGYTVGVLVQANHGAQQELMIAGVPIGDHLSMPRKAGEPPAGAGSIIVVVATDAPLLPHQLKRLAQRASLGLARVGATSSNFSGDIFIAFSTANPGAAEREGLRTVNMLPHDQLDPIFTAVVQATEESILNALVAGRTMTGINGNTVYGLPHDRVRELLREYNRLRE
jgi:D-aminopeptidase